MKKPTDRPKTILGNFTGRTPYAEACPFCGSKDPNLVKARISQFAVECDNCFARGPIGFNEIEAEVNWNQLDGVKR